MVIFVDFGFVALLAFFAVSVILGSAFTFTEWVMAHIPLIIALLLIKAIIWVLIDHSDGGIDVELNELVRLGLNIICIPLDMLRTGIFLWAVVGNLLTLFNGDFFHLLICLLGAVVAFPLFILCYSIGDMFLGGGLIIGEILSLGAWGLLFLFVKLIS